jgi:addiction module RelE/StbE family toxin
MTESEKLEVQWELSQGFKDSWKVYLKANPEIKSAMTDFDRCKRANPPSSLPRKMKDHKLDGPLSGFMDCHLAEDIILIYKPIANGGIKLFLICKHADLKGPKTRSLRKRLTK